MSSLGLGGLGFTCYPLQKKIWKCREWNLGPIALVRSDVLSSSDVYMCIYQFYCMLVSRDFWAVGTTKNTIYFTFQLSNSRILLKKLCGTLYRTNNSSLARKPVWKTLPVDCYLSTTRQLVKNQRIQKNVNIGRNVNQIPNLMIASYMINIIIIIIYCDLQLQRADDNTTNMTSITRQVYYCLLS